MVRDQAQDMGWCAKGEGSSSLLGKHLLRHFYVVSATWGQPAVQVVNFEQHIFRNGEDWYRQRIPVSKFILMPRKMAEYHVPFNQVTLDYIKLLRKQRHEDDMFSDVSASLNKWSLECK